MATGERLSIVVPSWREGARLIAALGAARDVAPDAEIVVGANAESAATRDAAVAAGAVWVEVPRASRGLQLARAAAAARGDLLLFLHADTRLPTGAAQHVGAACAKVGVAGGAFRLRFDREHPVFATLATLSALNLRAAYLGDQAMFCRRECYVAAGGFADLPLFEDVEFAHRLARVGRLVRLGATVTTSSRRFRERGPYRQLARNAAMLLAYHAGWSPRRLHAHYDRGAVGQGADRTA